MSKIEVMFDDDNNIAIGGHASPSELVDLAMTSISAALEGTKEGISRSVVFDEIITHIKNNKDLILEGKDHG